MVGLATGSSSASGCSQVSDYQLRFQKLVLGDNGAAASGPGEFGEGGEQVE